MSRPIINKEMKLEAAETIAKEMNACNAKDIAEHYNTYMDGYELAKELEQYAGWNDLTIDDVNTLDQMDTLVDQLLRDAEIKWFAENTIKPPLPIGTEIKQGIIDKIDNYGVARYLVKGRENPQDNSWLVIKFEDAIAV